MTAAPTATAATSLVPLNIAALLASQARADHDNDDCIIETHISWVLLTGAFAYKIRKPVVMPFLDFSTLAARLSDCEQEMRLNRRWAPLLYLAIVPIYGTAAAPSFHEQGAVIDYAVKMRRFADTARLDRLVDQQGLDAQLLRSLAKTTADMHLHAPPADLSTAYATPATIGAETQGNFSTLLKAENVGNSALLRSVCTFSTERVYELSATFEQRRHDGACRECHGDLHLQNLAFIDGEVVPFDAVEFEPAFRWVDVASDLAFLLMDVHARGFAEQAQQILNEYLLLTGDYALLAVLEHYLCYRAMVRAKIASIRSAQLAAGAVADAAALQADQFIALAATWCTTKPAPNLIITHGVSGSGKSWLAQRVAGKFNAICIRADVERKRLYNSATDRYSASATQRVYAHLLAQAGHAIAAGMNVILDATYLDRDERSRAARWADQRGIGFRILAVRAPRAQLEQRIEERARRGDDASEANMEVLAMQLASEHELDAAERAIALAVDEPRSGDIDAIVKRLDDLH
jgi:aminoglycoside phosphotransferase family enzyme/predicted kinase